MPVADRSKLLSPANLLSAGLTLAILSLLSGQLRFWALDGQVFIPPAKFGVPLGLLIALFALASAKFKSNNFCFPPWPFALGVAILFVGDWLVRDYNLLQGPAIRGEIILFTAVAFLGIRSRTVWPIKLLLPLSCMTLSLLFLAASNGSPITSDDHSTFIYRLSLLSKNFPNIPFYYPLWNAGLDARDFFATGALNAYALAFPLLQLFPVESVYNLIVVGVIFVLAPASIFAAAKLEKLPDLAPAIAGLLMLGGNLLWYRWTLKYGTLGFAVSASLIPLNLALANRVLAAAHKPLSNGIVLLSIATFSLMFLWSPSALVFLPLLGLALARSGRLILNSKVWLLVLGLLIINLPWTMLFWKVSKVDSFLSADTGTHQNLQIKAEQSVNDFAHQLKSRSKPFSVKHALKTVRENAVSCNSLLLMLLLPGLALMRSPARLSYSLMTAWLLALGILVPFLKPQLEFDRMLIVLSLLAGLPVSVALTNMLQSCFARPHPAKALLLSHCLGFLAAAQFSSGAVATNRSVEQFFFANNDFFPMREKIANLPGDSRILFSGFVLHELNGGHLAPLSELSGKALIASSPFHNLWRYRQIFPKEFLERGEQGIEDYLNLMNVGYVFAHEAEWKRYFRERPLQFRELEAIGRFVLFERSNFSGNYFLEGNGTLEQDGSAIRAVINSGSATLKFNYFPFLHSSDCKLEPAVVSASLTLLKLSECPPGKKIVIRSVSPWRRLWLEN